jgi:glutamate 5-kinase
MKTLVIKIGTSTLLQAHERPTNVFETVAASITALQGEYQIVLVTSGAIGFGVRELGLETRPVHVAELQAVASIGQVGLMQYWRAAFGKTPVGQILLTARDLDDPESVLPMVETFQSMWQLGVVPIVNENDAITSDEITFGDNDKLASMVAISVGVEQIVFLTDQDGIRAEFGTATERRLEVIALGDAQTHVTTAQSTHGKGGMASKLIAAELALEHGIVPYIGSPWQEMPVQAILAGKSGTKLV